MAIAVRYKGYWYPIEVIGHAVWLYHRFALSLRDVKELMVARGVVVTYETIRSWCAKFGPDYAARLLRRRPRPGDRWHLDEVFVKINGTTRYLWRAVDQHGSVLEILVQSRRNAVAAKRFFRKLLKGLRSAPRVIVTDKLASYQVALRELLPCLDAWSTMRGFSSLAEGVNPPTILQDFGLTLALLAAPTRGRSQRGRRGWPPPSQWPHTTTHPGDATWLPEQPPAVRIDHRGQIQLARLGGNLGHVPHPLAVRCTGHEIPLEQVRELRGRLVLTGQATTAADLARNEALATHRVGHRLFRHSPPRLPQISQQPRRTVQTLGFDERRFDRLVAPIGLGVHTVGVSHAAKPFIEPGHADTQQCTHKRMWHTVFGPLVDYKACHAHFVASFTHRTTDRLRTSRSTRCAG